MNAKPIQLFVIIPKMETFASIQKEVISVPVVHLSVRLATYGPTTNEGIAV